MAPKVSKDPVDKGWQFEALFKHEHLLGERIFTCGDEIARKLEALAPASAAPPLDAGRLVSPPAVSVPDEVRGAMQFFVHLLCHFAFQEHLLAEVTMLVVAVACGNPVAEANEV